MKLYRMTMLCLYALISFFVNQAFADTQTLKRSVIDAGRLHTVALESDGAVIGTGDNSHGQLDFDTWTDIDQVFAGRYTTFGLRGDGTVIVTGKPHPGQAKTGTWGEIVQVAAGDTHTVGLKADGTVIACGSGSYGKTNVSGWSDIIQIAAGPKHTLGLRSVYNPDNDAWDNTVVAAGLIGGVEGWTDIVQIDAGSEHSVGLISDGTVVASGGNKYNQCNVSGWEDIVQIAAGDWFTIGLKEDGAIVRTDTANTSVLPDVKRIAACGFHFAGVNENGTAEAAGDNQYGQINVATWGDISFPEMEVFPVVPLGETFDICAANKILFLWNSESDSHTLSIYSYDDPQIAIFTKNSIQGLMYWLDLNDPAVINPDLLPLEGEIIEYFWTVEVVGSLERSSGFFKLTTCQNAHDLAAIPCGNGCLKASSLPGYVCGMEEYGIDNICRWYCYHAAPCAYVEPSCKWFDEKKRNCVSSFELRFAKSCDGCY